MPREFAPNVNQYADGGYPERHKPSIGGHDMPPGAHRLLGTRASHGRSPAMMGDTAQASGPRTVGGDLFKQKALALALRQRGQGVPRGVAGY